MSLFSSINLSELPPPTVLEKLDYETLLTAVKNELQSLAPELDVNGLPESDPITKLLQVMTYRELHLRQRINESARGVMLATASGANLENLAALVNVRRLLITPGDPPVYEDDERLRARAQLAFEGFSTAGPEGAYVFHAMSASTEVKDVVVYSESPGQVEVRVLSNVGDGSASPALLATVETMLNDDKIRPITDYLTVKSADIQPYKISAVLMLFPGVGAQEVLASAQTAAQAFVDKHHGLGVDITRAGIFAALYQPGVQNITLTEPAGDILIERNQAPYGTLGTIGLLEHPTDAPGGLAAAVSFSGSTAGGQITGSVTITAAIEDYDISHYLIYWGANNAEKLPNGVKRYQFSGDDASLTLDHAAFENLLMTSDDGTAIYLSGVDYSVELTGANNDVQTGKLIATNTGITSATVRVSYSLPPIVEIAKSQPLTYTFPANTTVPIGATHLLVFTKNEFGEMLQGVSVAI